MAHSQKPNYVLVTGGSGCLGHRILYELLSSGYKVRATSRPHKVSTMRNMYSDFSPDVFDIFVMDDMVTVEWSKPLKDIDAVIHVAAPVTLGGITATDVYKAAVHGTRRLLAAVGKVKDMKRFVLTGSVAAFFEPDYSNVLQDVEFNEDTFRELDDIDPKQYTPPAAYVACKTISDKLIWKAAEQYPHIDFTVVFPPCVYGKFVEGYPTPSVDSLNANGFIYELLKPDGKFPPFPVIEQVHTKDVARAHILALTAAQLPSNSGGKKRFILSSGRMPWLEAVEYLKIQRPELSSRLVKVSEETKKAMPASHFKLDTKLAEEVLGMKPENMINWKETILEVVDWVIDWEKKSGKQAEA